MEVAGSSDTYLTTLTERRRNPRPSHITTNGRTVDQSVSRSGVSQSVGRSVSPVHRGLESLVRLMTIL